MVGFLIGWGRLEFVYVWREKKRKNRSEERGGKCKNQAPEIKGELGMRAPGRQGEGGKDREAVGKETWSRMRDHLPLGEESREIKGMEESGKGLQQLLRGIRKSISSKWRDCREAPREGPAATEEQDLIPLPVNILAAAKEKMCGLDPTKLEIISRKCDPE